MNRNVVISFSLLGVAAACVPGYLSQKSFLPVQPLPSPEDQVKNIAHEVRAIDNGQGRDRKVVKTLTGTDEGGELIAYFTGKALTKMTASLGMSNRVVDTGFYYRNQQLFFIRESYSYFWRDKNNTIKHDKPIENTFYFSQGQLIRHVIKDKDEDITLADKVEQLKSDAREYFEFACSSKQSLDVQEMGAGG